MSTPRGTTDGRCRACAVGRRIAAVTLQLIGFLVISFVVTSAARLGGNTAGSATFFTDGCAGCAADLSLTSIELQARQGSTLFVIGGTWPNSLQDLHTDLRLEANNLDLVLSPRTGPDGFAIVQATQGGTPIPADALAAGIQSGYLLIDVSDAVLRPPVEFSFGLWKDKRYQGRIPATGMLRWTGEGKPQAAVAATPSAGAVVPPVAAASATGLAATPSAAAAAARPEVTTLAGACAAIPSGSVAPYLVMSKVASGTDPDPRTKIPTRWVASAGTGSIPDTSRPPLSFTAVLLRAGQPAGTGARPIDRLGNLQLWAYWDGGAMHKAIRTFSAGSWHAAVDADADTLTVDLHVNGIAFFWRGLTAGDRYGFVAASASGCQPVALDAGGTPLEAVP